MRRYLTEFIGTFLLMLVIGMVVLAESEMAPLAIGAAVAALVYAGFHVSGGQYNPAVTVAVLVRGVLPAREVLPYWVAQLLGAALGAVTASYLSPERAKPALQFSGGAIVVVLVAEFVFTVALLWVVLHTATAPKAAGNSYYGLAIGAVVVAEPVGRHTMAT